MRPQNRPFVVEIKKTKRGGAPTGAAPTPAPATWAEQYEQATSLNDTAARKAADALFSKARVTAPPSEAPAPSGATMSEAAAATPGPSERSSRTGRVLMALDSTDLASASLASPELSAPTKAERPGVARVGRPRKALVAEAPATRQKQAQAWANEPARRTRVSPAKAEPPAANSAPAAAPAAAIAAAPRGVASTPVSDEIVAGPSSPAARKTGWRSARNAPLARGEKWKRRLPQVLR